MLGCSNKGADREGGVASLKTVESVDYYCDPSDIAVISDRDPFSGAKITCVFGISTGI
jgi:hypothetical protein